MARTHNTSINMVSGELNPGGAVLSMVPSGHFINVHFSYGVSIILPGFNAEAVTSARAMARKLTELADECERQMLVAENVA